MSKTNSPDTRLYFLLLLIFQLSISIRFAFSSFR